MYILYFLDLKFASRGKQCTYILFLNKMRKMRSAHARNLPLKFQIAQQSCGYMPIAADELSTANFSVCACQYEEKDFICSQNMSYPSECSVNTAGTLD